MLDYSKTWHVKDHLSDHDFAISIKDIVMKCWYFPRQSSHPSHPVNTLGPSQNGRHFADDTFKRIFLNDKFIISIKISLNFVPNDPIINIPALVQIMAWRRLGDKPLSEPMMVSLLTHICVTRLQWVKQFIVRSLKAARLDDNISFRNLTGVSAALLPNHFRSIRKLKYVSFENENCW